ncbi:TIGR02117 family protein [Flavobacterium sp. SM15]|uniref:TIGR02117 family protein n=1 Tax=Flavobacterium sp. SM15 TaxID=2908005 RepID=UPI001ED9D290|nr:TIGR02117 family protein [Flavobacterium sp. SM15]MCG2611898.1 TIGR02117 family protein [Flavobacterium sp. SM15]
MKTLKNSLKFLSKTLLGVTAFIILYIIAVLLFSRIPVNSNRTKPEKGIEVYLLSNDVHTDIVVPVKSKTIDWSEKVQFQHTKAKDTTARYLAFGWGDKGFYLNTPTWADLKFSTAFNAASGLSSSAMHCTFYKQMREDELCKKIIITEKQYQQLVVFIQNSFELENNKIMKIDTDAVYGKHDIFYEAKGSYNLFYTCNTWTNSALKAADQKASLWTVYDKGILYHYK